MKKLKKWLLGTMIGLSSIALLTGCGKSEGPKFLKGILTEIEYGEFLLMGEYIDYVEDSEYTIIVKDANGVEEDITNKNSWVPPEPGVYTVIYTVASGANKGTNSFEITVTAPKIRVSYSLQNPTFVVGETVSFASYFEGMNISAQSYYPTQTLMESVTVGETTTSLEGQTEYTFAQGGDHTFKFYVQSDDGQKFEMEETVVVYGWNQDTYSWMKENNFSGYKLDEVTADKKIVIGAGTHSGESGQFPFGGQKHDLGYFAYNGEYGIGDYITVDFTGDNMPVFSFFRNQVTNSYFWGQYNSDAKNKGIVIVNGYRLKNGTNASDFNGGRNSLLQLFGIYGLEHQQLGTGHERQFLADNIGQNDFGIEDLQTTYANTPLRMIVGFSAGTTTSVTVNTALINRDTSQVLHVAEQTIKVGTGGTIPEGYFEGSFVMYGTHGKTITLDKVYEISEDTSMEALLEGYNTDTPPTPPTPPIGDGITAEMQTWMTQNNVTGSGIATTTPAGGLTFEAGSTGGSNPANADGSLGYLAYNGSYGAGDYVVVDFTGNNMPAIQFLRTVVADDYINGENEQLDKHKGVLMFNGHLKSTGDGGWKTDSLYVTGMYSLVNIGGNDNFNDQQYRMLAISPDYGFADLANSSKSYRMMAGLSAIGSEIVLSIAIVDLADNTLEYSVDYKFTHNVDMATFGTEGIIQIFGRYGTTTTLDKVYAIEENTNLEALYTKYNVVVPTNDPAAPMQAWLTENNIKVAGVASTTADRKVVFGAGVAGAGHPHDSNGVLGYLAYDGSYGANDFVVVDFTGNNLPTIQFLRTVIADDYFNPENEQLDKHKGVLFCNGHLNASGTGGWKRDNLWVSGMYGITNIGGDDNFNPQQNRLFSVAEDFGFEDLKDSTTKYRMIVGLTSLENGKLNAHLVIINLDTGAVVVNNAFEMTHNVADMAAFGTEGIIQIFGQYGKTTTLDKVYAIEENTTMAALLEKYTPSN